MVEFLSFPGTVNTLRSLLLVGALVLAPGWARAQEAPVVTAPPLGSFSAMRVAIVPVQLFRADTAGWSAAVNWGTLRVTLDSLIGEELRDRGLGTRWAYARDVVRSARRNPTYATDPYALGVGRWRSTPPKADEAMPPVVADNLRPLTALGDTRYALIPVELRGQGSDAVLRLVLADTRARRVVWAGDLLITGSADLTGDIARRVADLVMEP
jgi:hypothetical protein